MAPRTGGVAAIECTFLPGDLGARGQLIPYLSVADRSSTSAPVEAAFV